MLRRVSEYAQDQLDIDSLQQAPRWTVMYDEFFGEQLSRFWEESDYYEWYEPTEAEVDRYMNSTVFGVDDFRRLAQASSLLDKERVEALFRNGIVACEYQQNRNTTITEQSFVFLTKCRYRPKHVRIDNVYYETPLWFRNMNQRSFIPTVADPTGDKAYYPKKLPSETISQALHLGYFEHTHACRDGYDCMGGDYINWTDVVQLDTDEMVAEAKRVPRMYADKLSTINLDSPYGSNNVLEFKHSELKRFRTRPDFERVSSPRLSL